MVLQNAGGALYWLMMVIEHADYSGCRRGCNPGPGKTPATDQEGEVANKRQAAPIWAPWRIEYIRQAQRDQSCFLCGLERPPPADAVDDLVILRGKTCFLILNRYPYNSGHLMAAPYRHVADPAALTRTEAAELWQLTMRGRELLLAAMRPGVFNLGINLGAAAGAGLEGHLHQHLVPRWRGDTNFMPVLGGVRVVPEALTATAALLRNLAGSRTGRPRARTCGHR